MTCLAKLKDGALTPVLEDFGEAKTGGLQHRCASKLCEDQMCIFPETRRKDDFVSITYNSNIDTVLTDIENDEVYLQVSGRGTDGQFYNLVPDEQVTSTPELKMCLSQASPASIVGLSCPTTSSKTSCLKDWNC